MRYQGRELRRLWEIKVYKGKRNIKNPKTVKKTIIAFNAVEAIRMCGGEAAEQPKPLCYVTWPEPDSERVFRIDDTAGPTDEAIVPSIAVENA